MNRFKTADGLSLAYVDEGAGEGPPLLCLAGLTRSSRDFDQFAEIARKTHRVIRLDARGRGQSERAKDFLRDNPELFEEIRAKVLDKRLPKKKAEDVNENV